MSPLFLIPLIYLASALQTLQAPQWQIAGVGPDLIALTGFTWLALSKNRYSFAIVALVGLAADFNSPAPLGLSLAVYAIVAYLLTRLRSRIHLDHFAGQLGVIFLGSRGHLPGAKCYVANPSAIRAALADAFAAVVISRFLHCRPGDPDSDAGRLAANSVSHDRVGRRLTTPRSPLPFPASHLRSQSLNRRLRWLFAAFVALSVTVYGRLIALESARWP